MRFAAGVPRRKANSKFEKHREKKKKKSLTAMATRSNMKGFYKQKKSSISKKKKSPAASIGSDVTQPSALISHGTPDLKDDYDGEEELLRQFDLNTYLYGPCLGITRLARWERACKLGMNPPKEVESLLKGGKVRLDSL